MREIDAVFRALQGSAFRRRFHLKERERGYLTSKGMEQVMQHARDFIDKRLAPLNPPNDGRQTPFRGHPVFVAQHATATCCRSCLEKWHGIAGDHALDEEEVRHVLAVLERWLRREAVDKEEDSRALDLFQ